MPAVTEPAPAMAEPAPAVGKSVPAVAEVASAYATAGAQVVPAHVRDQVVEGGDALEDCTDKELLVCYLFFPPYYLGS